MIGDFREIAATDEMPYGGIPYSKILPKYEVTNPNLIKTGIDAGINSIYGSDSNYLSSANIHDESPYENYARSEIIDWSPDAPLFESDHARRDPAYSKSVINLRYNGNRGNTSDIPRHPELFIGFTGNDPRGSTNDPRMDQFRGFMNANAANLQVRMGNNDDNHIVERPWTNQSISYDKKYMQQISANNLKIFSTQKEGRPYSRNVVTDLPTWGKNQNKIRSSNMNAGDETINLNNRGDYGEYIDVGGEVNQILSNDLQAINAMKAPSNLNKLYTDQDFEIQINNFHAGAGNNYLSNNVGLKNTGFDHVSIEDIDGTTLGALSGLNKKNLASSMALAAKMASTIKNTSSYDIQNQNIDNSNINISQRIANDISNIYKKMEYGQSYGESNEGFTNGGLIQRRTTDAGKKVVYDPESNMSQKMETVSSIVKGLKENTASSKRKIIDQIVAHFTPSPVDANMTPSSNMLPSKDHIRHKHKSEVGSSIFKNFVNGNTAINKFRPSMRREKKVHFAQSNGAADATNWQESHLTQNGKNNYHKDDHNRFNKGKHALSQTDWQNSAEMQMLKTKNPELYARVKNEAANSVMDWQDSDIASYGMNAHEREKNIMKLAQGTYTPDTWNEGYNEIGIGKQQGLSNRRSAQNEPVVLDNQFNENYQSFAPSIGGAGPKTLRGGAWNTDMESGQMSDVVFGGGAF